MDVLVIGSGGREYALVWKIAQSPMVGKVYCAPGNAGIAQQAECIAISTQDFDGLVQFTRDKQIGLVIVGPEDPLAHGIVDRFHEEGLMVFGPRAAAAQLESSKSFAKRLMMKYGIPTGAYAEFSDAEEAIAYVKDRGAPVVVKADGLAAGKGVTVARDVNAAVNAICQAMLDRAFGEAGSRIIIEEYLEGEEASILAFTDGRTVVPMATSQDHKPVFDGDEGPNTGGMGAYSPAPVVTPEWCAEIQRTILQPTVDAMASEGAPYAGVLYAGLMMTVNGPKVIEFNCRFGDPETQVVLPRMKSDIIPVFVACTNGSLDQIQIEWTQDACVTVVMASGGYPGPYQKGKPIEGLDDAQREGAAMVFHAGTAWDNGRVVTNGGRVLNVTACGETIPKAIDAAYAAVRCIHFEDAHYRNDIGSKALKHLGL